MVQKTTIEISTRLRDFLIKNSTNKKQSYEDVILLLLGTKQLTKEQKEECKKNYESRCKIKSK